MPKYREIFIKKESKIVVWKIEEEENSLLQLFDSEETRKTMDRYKSSLHRLQFIATQLILHREGVQDVIFKDENGKPHLDSGRQISISHDANFVAVMFSTEKCGLDLQSKNEKVFRIEHKFRDVEDVLLEENPLDGLTLLWSLKEALYKVNGDPMVYFKEHIRIKQETLWTANAQILYPAYLNSYKMSIKMIDDVYLTHTV